MWWFFFSPYIWWTHALLDMWHVSYIYSNVAYILSLLTVLVCHNLFSYFLFLFVIFLWHFFCSMYVQSHTHISPLVEFEKKNKQMKRISKYATLAHSPSLLDCEIMAILKLLYLRLDLTWIEVRLFCVVSL